MEPSKKSLLYWEIGDLCEYKEKNVLIPVEIIAKLKSKEPLENREYIRYTFKRYDRDHKNEFSLYLFLEFFEDTIPECPTLQSLGTELKIN